MFIQKLKIKNFKSISNFEYTFDTINILSGNNGVGKTAILEAITFCLTNHLSDKISEYVKWGCKKFEITLEFEHNNHQYHYYIEGSNATDRKLIIDGDEENPLLKSDCVEELKKIINQEIALYSNISMQGKSTQLLFEKPTARLERFKNLLGLDEIRISIQKIDEDVTKNKIQLNTLETEYNVLKNRSFTLQDIPDKKDYKEIDEEVTQLLDKKLSYSLREVKEYDDFRLNNLYTNFNSLEKEEIGYIQIIAKYNLDQEKIKKLNSQRDQYKKQLDAFIIPRVKECEYFNEDLSLIEKDTDEIFLKISECTFKLKDLENKKKLAEKGKCPTCEQEYKADISLIITDIKKINEHLEQFEKAKESLKEKKKEYTLALSDYNTKFQEKEILKEKKYNIENLHNNIIKQIEDIQILNKPEEKDFEADKKILLDSIEAEKVIKNQYDLAIKENNSIISELAKIDTEVKILTNKKQTLLEQQEQEIKRILVFNEIVKKEKKENEELFYSKEELILKLKKENNLLASAKKLLDKEFSSFLIDEGTEFIKNKMNSIFAKAYGKYQVTIRKDGKGVDFLYSMDNKTWTSVNMASGYEKQLLSMSFRISLSYLHNLNIFILDEIDSDASDENGLRLYNILFNEIQTGQFFIISHKESVKDFLYNNDRCSFINLE